MSDIIRPRNEGERKIISNGELRIFAEGKLGAIVQFPMLVDTGSGYVEKIFERFARPPGTRIIAVRDGNIYLQKEHRLESNNEFDWRLPGGKVFDSFTEFRSFIGKEVPLDTVLSAGHRELHEEACLECETLTLLKRSTCGASVEWDLYYLLATKVTSTETTHDEGEEIIDGQWFSYEKVLDMCDSGEIDEDRTIAVLRSSVLKEKFRK